MLRVGPSFVPWMFAGPLALLIVIQLALGVSGGGGCFARRKDSPIGFWLNIAAQVAFVGAICLLVNR